MLKKYSFLYLFSFILSLSTAFSCSSRHSDRDAINESLQTAYDAMERGEFNAAIDICNRLTQGKDSTLMGWREYCRAAAIYALAYDHDYDTESSMVAATRCISRAENLQSDSVKQYMAALPGELSVPLNTAIRTLEGLNTDRSTIGDHEEGDSHISEHSDHETD